MDHFKDFERESKTKRFSQARESMERGQPMASYFKLFQWSVKIVKELIFSVALGRSRSIVETRHWGSLGSLGVTGVTLQVGLNKEDRADPEEQKRREMISWIQDMLSNLEKASSWVCFLLEKWWNHLKRLVSPF